VRKVECYIFDNNSQVYEAFSESKYRIDLNRRIVPRVAMDAVKFPWVG
jgi:hypothetical protein